MNDKTYLARWSRGQMDDKALSALEGVDAPPIYRQILTATDALKVAVPESLEWETFTKKCKSKAPVKPLYSRVIWSVAASVLLLIGISTYFMSARTLTAEGKITYFTLPDGSVAQLNPGAVLKYTVNYGWWNRDVQVNGDVIFTVKTGAPFRVHTTEGEVAVLGTVFRVLAFKNYFEVRCKEGTVAVSHKEEKIKLEAGSGYSSISKKNSSNKIGYFDAEEGLYYNEFPLNHLITVVEQVYGMEIRLNTSKPYYFTGILPLTDKKAALQVLTEPFALEFTVLADGSIEIEAP